MRAVVIHGIMVPHDSPHRSSFQVDFFLHQPIKTLYSSEVIGLITRVWIDTENNIWMRGIIHSVLPRGMSLDDCELSYGFVYVPVDRTAYREHCRLGPLPDGTVPRDGYCMLVLKADSVHKKDVCNIRPKQASFNAIFNRELYG